jgi:hypothetical protein
MVCFKLRTLFRGTILSILILNGLLMAQDGEKLIQPSAKKSLHATGEAIYMKLCASCHGASGEGVSGNYPDPLIGDSTVGELTKIIHDRCPKASLICARAKMQGQLLPTFTKSSSVPRRNPDAILGSLASRDLPAINFAKVWPICMRGTQVSLSRRTNGE